MSVGRPSKESAGTSETHAQNFDSAKNILNEAIKAHFALPRNMLLKDAQRCSVTLDRVQLTYHNYLYETKEEAEADSQMEMYGVAKYLDQYLARMVNVWKDHTPDMKFDFLGEGPATAIYVCEDFADCNNALAKDEMWEKLPHSDLHYGDGEGSGVGRQEDKD